MVDRRKKLMMMGRSGTTYFVDATLGSDANGGASIAAPWQTLTKVNAAVFKPGDKILLKRGETWTDSVSQYALVVNENNITVDAYGSGNAPIIVGNATDFDDYCIHLSGNGSKVKNLKLTTAREGAILISGVGCEVCNCEMTAVGAGARITGPNALFHNNNVHHLKMVRNDATPNQDYGAMGVNFWPGSDGARVYNNTFAYCEAPSTDYTMDGGAIEVWRSVNNIQVYNNFAFHCCGFSEFGGYALTDTVTNFKIYNNIISQCNWLAVINCGSTYEIDIQSLSFDHNTVSSPGSTVIRFSDNAPNYGSKLILRNNIFNGLRDFSYQGNGDNFTHTYNLYSGTGPTSPGTGEVVLTDPLLTAAPMMDVTFDGGVLVSGGFGDSGVDSVSDATKFAIASGYALNSSLYGVRVTVPTGTTQTDCTKTVKVPTNITKMWVEFWFDPNSIALNAGDEVLVASDYIGGAPYQTWKFQLDAWASPYRYVLYSVKDDGSSTTANGTLSDAPHQIRVYLTRAATSVSADGTATWYIDNMVTPVSSMTGLDNYHIFALIESYKFGMLYSGSLAAAGGTYYIDGYRVTYEAGLGTDVVADFHPGVGSPALLGGVTSTVLLDYGGNARGATPTLGAWEA